MTPTDIELSVAIIYAPWDTARQRNSIRLSQTLDSMGITNERVRAKQDESLWETAQRAWRQTPATATHRLLFPDDVDIVDNFGRLATDALAERPKSPVSFFLLHSDIVAEARERGVSWATTGGAWGQAICLPTEYIDQMLTWCDESVKPDVTHDDVTVSVWAMYDLDEQFWNTVPSLVEHIGADDSLLGNQPPIDRTAAWYDPDVTHDDVAYDVQENIPSQEPPYNGARDREILYPNVKAEIESKL